MPGEGKGVGEEKVSMGAEVHYTSCRILSAMASTAAAAGDVPLR